MPVNVAILRAWPNWLIIPAMLALWVVVGVLCAELLGAQPWHAEQQS